MSLIFLLTVLSSFSQENYPKKVVVENDTLICISPEQLTRVNLLIVENQKCKDLSKLNSTELKKLTEIVETQDKVISNHEDQEIILKQTITDQENTISIKNKTIKRSKIKTKIFSAASFVIGAVLTYFVII